MKAFTISMMFAAAIAMAAPSNANAQPNSRARHYSPQAGSYAHSYKRARKIRRQIVKLNNQSQTLLVKHKRLKRRAQKMRARGYYGQARRVRRAMRANMNQVRALQAQIIGLKRTLARLNKRFSSKVTVKNLKRRPVIVEVRMGFNQTCRLNPRVAKNVLRPGQKLSVRRRGTVVCYRQLKVRRHARRAMASGWMKSTLPRPGNYKFVLKARRKHHRKAVGYNR